MWWIPVRYHRWCAPVTERLRVKARITTLGVNAGEHVEIEDTPSVRRKLRSGWFVLLVEDDNGTREGISE